MIGTRRRLMLIAGVVLATALLTFTATRLLVQVPQNTEAIKARCENGNKVIARINVKFAQLVALFDQAQAQQSPRPGQDPPSPAILAAYAEFRKPIPPNDCSHLP